MWQRTGIGLVLTGMVLGTAGCATNREGSKAWLKQEVARLDQERAAGELTAWEYWQAVHEAEAVRQEHREELRRAQQRHFEHREMIRKSRGLHHGALGRHR